MRYDAPFEISQRNVTPVNFYTHIRVPLLLIDTSNTWKTQINEPSAASETCRLCRTPCTKWFPVSSFIRRRLASAPFAYNHTSFHPSHISVRQASFADITHFLYRLIKPPSSQLSLSSYPNFPGTTGSPALSPPSTAHPCPLT